MNSQLLALLITGFSWAQGSDFPQGCPTENLNNVCAKLAQISNDKILVFADGTQMPACYLETADSKSAATNSQQNEIVERAIYDAQLKRLFPGDVKPTTQQVENMLGASARIRATLDSSYNIEEIKRLSSDSDFIKKIDDYRKYKESIRPPKRLLGNSLQKDLEFAKTRATELISSLKTETNKSTIEDFTKEVAAAYPGFSEASKAIPCRPYINAFFTPQEFVFTMGGQKSVSKANGITLSPALTQLPTASRMHLIGHEIGHGLDPCNKKLEGTHPFAKLIDCIQKEVGYFKKEFMSDACDPHTREAFCDHIGNYIMEEWAKQPAPAVEMPERRPNMIFMPPGYEYIIHDLDMYCGSRGEMDSYSSHPASDRRFTEITMKSPTIAKKLNCPTSPTTYRCDVKNGAVGAKPPWYQQIYEKGKIFIRR